MIINANQGTWTPDEYGNAGRFELAEGLFGGFPPPEKITVVGLMGRTIEFELVEKEIRGLEAGSERFIGWSYWEDEVPAGATIVNLLVAA